MSQINLGFYFNEGLYCPTAGVLYLLNFFYLCYLDYCLSNQLVEHEFFLFYYDTLMCDTDEDLCDLAV